MQGPWSFLGCRAALWFKHLPFLEHSLLSQAVWEMDPPWVLHCSNSAGDAQLLTQGLGLLLPPPCTGASWAMLWVQRVSKQGDKFQKLLSYGVWTSLLYKKYKFLQFGMFITSQWARHCAWKAETLFVSLIMIEFFPPVVLCVQHVPVVPASASLTQENLKNEICAC